MSSPGWKKPSGLVRRKSQRSSLPKSTAAKENALTPTTASASPRSPAAKKRRNPFGGARASPKKKSKLLDVNIEHDVTQDGIELFNALETAGSEKGEVKRKSVEAHTVKHPEIVTEDQPSVPEKAPQDEKPPSVPDLFPSYPVDWSLKTKVRFISEKPFDWANQMKSRDEASGIVSFTKQTVHQNLQNVDDASKASCLQSCIMYWIHPHIPWLKMFPRISLEKSVGRPNIMAQDPDIQRSLMNDWTTSFTSIFHMLRSGNCPYFYLCCHQFTVLFRLADNTQIEAMLTPTSRGFRESLKSEGVEFSMPLNPAGKNVELTDDKSQDSQTAASQGADDSNMNPEKSTCDPEVTPGAGNMEEQQEDLTATDEGASSWLETLGIDKAKYRSLNPDKVKLQRDVYRSIDHRPASVIVVRGTAAAVALYNFLLNCRTAVAATGPQAAVPPTILAPTPFTGATLASAKVKAGSIRQQQPDGTIQYQSSLELAGPLLPSCLTAIQSLLRRTQKGSGFSASYSVHEPTTPFNVALERSEDVGEECRKDVSDVDEVITSWSGVDCESAGDGETRKDSEEKGGEGRKKAFHGAIEAVRLNTVVNNGKQAIRELECHDGGYCWST